MSEWAEQDVAAGQASDWPLRPWILAGIGAVAGLIVHLLLENEGESAFGAALAAFVFFAAAALAFVLRPGRWLEPVFYALGLGAVMGGIGWFAAEWNDRRPVTEFAFAAGVFFSILAIPLFQAGFHRLRWATPYVETHRHVWTDVVSAGGAIAFTLLSWLVLWLLHALFSLIGIDAIEDLIEMDGFGGLFTGAAFGAAMGILRNELAIIGTLQRVVMLVLSLLAVPFGFGILAFIVVLLLSGGNALWNATDDATPVLLACAVGCFVLANTVVRDDDDARSDNVAMQAAALILAAAILPLTVFAAISMGLRIEQYGLAPERLWALVAIAIGTAYGLAYWVALVRGRLDGWADYLRRANLHLAVASCAVALVLALPIFDFGAISARNQIARLEGGKVALEDFDFRALRWEFGDAGRQALARLAQGEGETADLAAEAAASEDRHAHDFAENNRAEDRLANLQAEAITDPQTREALISYLRENPYFCDAICVAIPFDAADGEPYIALVERERVQHLEVAPAGGGGIEIRQSLRDLLRAREAEVQRDSVVEIREWSGRRIYVDGRPVGYPFE